MIPKIHHRWVGLKPCPNGRFVALGCPHYSVWYWTCHSSTTRFKRAYPRDFGNFDYKAIRFFWHTNFGSPKPLMLRGRWRLGTVHVVLLAMAHVGPVGCDLMQVVCYTCIKTDHQIIFWLFPDPTGETFHWWCLRNGCSKSPICSWHQGIALTITAKSWTKLSRRRKMRNSC